VSFPFPPYLEEATSKRQPYKASLFSAFFCSATPALELAKSIRIFATLHDRFATDVALPHSLVSVPDVVVAVSAFAVRLVVNIASMFIRQYCRTDKTKKRRLAFLPIRMNNGVPAKLSHKQAFS
jgi:hypothetical protein